jgi:hypothetical protein
VVELPVSVVAVQGTSLPGAEVALVATFLTQPLSEGSAAAPGPPAGAAPPDFPLPFALVPRNQAAASGGGDGNEEMPAGSARPPDGADAAGWHGFPLGVEGTYQRWKLQYEDELRPHQPPGPGADPQTVPGEGAADVPTPDVTEANGPWEAEPPTRTERAVQAFRETPPSQAPARCTGLVACRRLPAPARCTGPGGGGPGGTVST